MPTLPVLVRALSFAPFVAAVLIYLTTFTSWPVSLGVFWPLHLVALGMFAGALLWNLLGVGGIRTAADLVPGWRGPVAVVAVLFAVANFLLSGIGSTTTPGAPAPTDTDSELVRVVSNHGQTVRWLTPAEVAVEERNDLRGLAGHWIAFTLAAALMVDGGYARRAGVSAPTV